MKKLLSKLLILSIFASNLSFQPIKATASENALYSIYAVLGTFISVAIFMKAKGYGLDDINKAWDNLKAKISSSSTKQKDAANETAKVIANQASQGKNATQIAPATAESLTNLGFPTETKIIQNVVDSPQVRESAGEYYAYYATYQPEAQTSKQPKTSTATEENQPEIASRNIQDIELETPLVTSSNDPELTKYAKQLISGEKVVKPFTDTPNLPTKANPLVEKLGLNASHIKTLQDLNATHIKVGDNYYQIEQGKPIGEPLSFNISGDFGKIPMNKVPAGLKAANIQEVYKSNYQTQFFE